MSALRPIPQRMIIPLKDPCDGIFADEAIVLTLHDEGAGSFIAMQCRNLSPTAEYDAHTVTLCPPQLRELADIADRMLEVAGDREDTAP